MNIIQCIINFFRAVSIAFLLSLRVAALTYTIPGTNISLEYSIDESSAEIVGCNSDASGALVIPDYIDGYAVKKIGDFSIVFCRDLTSIQIGSMVEVFPSTALYGSYNIVSVIVDSQNQNYSSIDGVLYNKNGDVLIHYPGGIDDGIIVPDGVKEIGDYSCMYNRSSEVFLPKGLERIGDSAFYLSEIFDSLVVPDGVVEIGESAFQNTGFSTIELPDSLQSMGARTFRANIALTSVVLPRGLESIPAEAFISCNSLAEIVFPDQLQSIGRSAFESCRSLVNLIIPSTVTDIEDFAFRNCGDLEMVTFAGNAPENFGDDVFYYSPYSVPPRSQEFSLYFYSESVGFSEPTWMGYPSAMVEAPEPVMPKISVISLSYELLPYDEVYEGRVILLVEALDPAFMYNVHATSDLSIPFADWIVISDDRGTGLEEIQYNYYVDMPSQVFYSITTELFRE